MSNDKPLSDPSLWSRGTLQRAARQQRGQPEGPQAPPATDSTEPVQGLSRDYPGDVS